MKIILLSISLVLAFSYSLGQNNLVKNPSFEKNEYKGKGVIEVKQHGNQITSWKSPLSHHPTLYVQPKKSIAVAAEGNSSVGLLLGSSKQEKTKLEYITGELTQPLKKGEVYCMCFNVLLHRTSKWAATDVGVLLHTDRKVLSDISEPTSLTATMYLNERGPVTGTKWKKYCGYYKASGGEKFISFGKFGESEAVALKDLNQDSYFELDGYQNKAYYLIDDFSIIAKSSTTDCGCAEDMPIDEEDSTIVKETPPPYLFALDASGSMKKDHLWDSLRVNLIRFLNGLPDGSPVSFVTFSSSARPVFSGEISPKTINTVDSLLQKSPIGGGTNVFLGLQMAYASWPTEVPDSAKLVFISDGEFKVTPKIVNIVKTQYETRGRLLTLIQIGARATGLEELDPYMEAYIHTTASELSQAVDQIIATGGHGGKAATCECVEEFSPVMNYHFVIDYSGSMSEEKSRAIMAVRGLYSQVPDNAFVSVTTFTTHSQQLFVGKKTDLSGAQLSMMLGGQFAGGGTDPTPGIQDALKLAEKYSPDRFSHIILVTDLSAFFLSRKNDMNMSMIESGKKFDLAGSAIEVAVDGMVTSSSQFDFASGNYAVVPRSKFEKDLFSIDRSSCDYTSQAYHYNPAKGYARSGTKKFFAFFLKTLVESQMN